jgi:hypothetical protein
MTDYGKLYDEYLYDCYIANQNLTDEDWQYYGREEHHIEIPSRDEGVLTPLNAQHLTKYQHWLAGVLQSEVLGKCCFAFVPADVLPTWVETLRRKWVVQGSIETQANLPLEPKQERMRRGVETYMANSTPEERSEKGRRARARGLANTTPEQRTAVARAAGLGRMAKLTHEERVALGNHAAYSRTPEQRSEAVRQGRAAMSAERRSEIARKRVQSMTPEERKEVARKGWETRRRKAQGQ